MFIDYVTLLLVNMAAGYMLLAAFVFRALDNSDHRNWAPGFGMVGLIALVFGGIIATTWPLPGPFNSMYGDMSVFFGLIFLGAAVAMARGWSLMSVTVYAFFAGAAAMVIGAAVLRLGLTPKPLLTGVGFVLSGLGGVMAAPTYRFARRNLYFRTAAAAVLALTALLWLANGLPAYWMHLTLDSFGKWVPLAMRAAGK